MRYTVCLECTTLADVRQSTVLHKTAERDALYSQQPNNARHFQEQVPLEPLLAGPQDIVGGTCARQRVYDVPESDDD